MPYTPTVWENRPSRATPIDADNLNKIEIGIQSAAANADSASSTASAASTNASSALAASSANSNQLAALSSSTVYANSTLFPGLDPTGATSSRLAIQNAITATPVGGTLVIPPGTYLHSGGASWTNTTSGGVRKSITIDWSDATIIADGTVAPFSLVGGFDTTYNANSIEIVQVTQDNTSFPITLPGVKVNMASTSGISWSRGDVVRIFADDVIPDARPGDGTVESRVGQDMTFFSNDSTSVTLLGTLEDPYTTNIRVARFAPDIAVSVLCGKIRLSDAALAERRNINMFVLRSLVRPELISPRIDRAAAPMVSIQGCYSAKVSDLNVGYGVDDPGAGALGYGIIVQASSHTRVERPLGRNLRHLYTDDSSRIAAGNTSIHAYGRTFYSMVIDGVGDGSSNAPFDTHQSSLGVTFQGCLALNSESGYQLRGKKNRILSSQSANCRNGIRYFTESEGGGSSDHVVKDFISRNDEYGIYAEVNPTGSPSAGVRETRAFVVSGLTIQENRRIGIYARNILARVSNFRYAAGASLANGSSALYLYNSQMSVMGGVEYDFRSNTSGEALSVIGVSNATASVFESSDAFYYAPLSGAARVTSYMSNAGSLVSRVGLQSMSQAPSTIYSAFSSGGWFEWRNLQNQRTSESINASGTSVTSATSLAGVGRTRIKSILLSLDAAGADRTLAVLPSPQDSGQVLSVVNSGSANTVTIVHGATGNTLLSGAANKTLSPGQSVLLQANELSSWRQVTAVL